MRLTERDDNLFINEDLSGFITKFTGATDRADVCNINELSGSALRDACYRRNPVTSKTRPSVNSMIERAEKKFKKYQTIYKELFAEENINLS